MRTIHERFWEKVEKTETCWLWKACLFKGIHRGYGCFGIDKKNKTAHRVSYEWAKGPIPEGFELDHLCRVRKCVNPDHLEPVTRKENQRRGIGFSGLNHRKTHCPNGHKLEGSNLTATMLKAGKRDCRICRNKRKITKRREQGILGKGKNTHCTRGHKYPPNPKLTKSGWRKCRDCEIIRYEEVKKKRILGSVVP